MLVCQRASPKCSTVHVCAFSLKSHLTYHLRLPASRKSTKQHMAPGSEHAQCTHAGSELSLVRAKVKNIGAAMVAFGRDARYEKTAVAAFWRSRTCAFNAIHCMPEPSFRGRLVHAREKNPHSTSLGQSQLTYPPAPCYESRIYDNIHDAGIRTRAIYSRWF